MRRLRTLSEAECWARCYGGWEPTVTIVKLEPRRIPPEKLCFSGGENELRDASAREASLLRR